MARRKSWALTESTYGVCIKWDQLNKAVDLDLQAVIVDNRGHIVDAVYYNNLFAMSGAVGLSGDKSEDESIWVRLQKLPDQVQLIIFVVAAYSGGSLRDVTNGRVVVLERKASCTASFRQFKLERSRSNADMIAMFKRFKDNTWGLVELDEPAEHGSHFLDILEPTIGDLIRSEIPSAPMRLKVAFLMEKGALVDFPQGDALRRLVVAVGGTFASEDFSGDLSIELQASFFSASGDMLGTVKGDDQGMFGVERLEDEMEDEEALTMDLVQVPETVAQIFLVLLIHNHTFKSVQSVRARVIDQSLHEIMRYEVGAAGHDDDSGLVLARVLRKDKCNRWGIETVGKFFDSEKLDTELHELALSKPADALGKRKQAAKVAPRSPPRSPKVDPEKKAIPSSPRIAPKEKALEGAPAEAAVVPAEVAALPAADQAGADEAGDSGAKAALISSSPKAAIAGQSGRALFGTRRNGGTKDFSSQMGVSANCSKGEKLLAECLGAGEGTPASKGSLGTLVSLGDMPEVVQRCLGLTRITEEAHSGADERAGGWSTEEAESTAVSPSAAHTTLLFKECKVSDTRLLEELLQETTPAQTVRGCLCSPSLSS